jgi:hypothetical protein
VVVSDRVVARLGAPEPAYWSLNVYPGAGEASGCFVPSLRRHGGGSGVLAADPERSAREAGRRARGRLRRYCAANRLDRLGTLTYAGEGCHDPRQVRGDVALFFTRLREALGGDPFPYLWVAEWHKTGHGLHLHFGVGQFIPRALIAQAWGHGFVHIKQLSGVPAGSGQWGRARRAAGYLSKYVAKGFEDSDSGRRPRGLHRFDRAQGFTPGVFQLRGVSAFDVTCQACTVMGAPVARYWSSDEAGDWKGAPAIWLQWDGG